MVCFIYFQYKKCYFQSAQPVILLGIIVAFHKFYIINDSFYHTFDNSMSLMYFLTSQLVALYFLRRKTNNCFAYVLPYVVCLDTKQKFSGPTLSSGFSPLLLQRPCLPGIKLEPPANETYHLLSYLSDSYHLYDYFYRA